MMKYVVRTCLYRTVDGFYYGVGYHQLEEPQALLYPKCFKFSSTAMNIPHSTNRIPHITEHPPQH